MNPVGPDRTGRGHPHRPHRQADDAGPGEIGAVLRLALLPPLVLLTQMVLRELALTGSNQSAYATFLLGLATWPTGKACIRDVSGIERSRADAAPLSDADLARP